MLSAMRRGARRAMAGPRFSRGYKISAEEIGPPAETLALMEKLESKGVSYGDHVGMEKTGSEAQCPFLKTKPALLRSAEHESNARGYVRRNPFTIASAEGIILTDTDGKKYYDCLGCAGTLALGHNHPVIKDAIRGYVEGTAPQQALDLSTVEKDAFMESLFSVIPSGPGELEVAHHCSPAGTDVLDAAVKLAKMATGRRHVLAFHGGYHGHGHGPLAMMGNLGAKTKTPGTMADVHFLPYPYQYRNPFGLKGEEGERAVIQYIETLLRDDESGLPAPAALVMEAIQGEGGVNPMSPWAMQEVRRITKEHGIVLIMDEVQSGVCRSGDFWAFQESGIVPDILCMSKALGGSMPMAVMAYRKELDKWSPGAHTGTFRGNQLAMVCGRASLEWMKEVKLWEQVREKGDFLRQKMTALQSEVKSIGDVRGRGLMQGIEFVHPEGGPVDHRGWPEPHGGIAAEVQYQCLKRGLIIERGGRQGSVLRFLCPLIIEKEELDICTDIFADAVRAAEKIHL